MCGDGVTHTSTRPHVQLPTFDDGCVLLCLPSPMQTTKVYAQQILSGIVYLHRRSVPHRDLGSHTVYFDAKGRALLTDFGISSKANDLMSQASGLLQGDHLSAQGTQH